MGSHSLLADVLVVLAAAIAVVPVFRRLRASPVLGYLAAGVLVGPHALGLVSDVEGAEALGHLGVVFLLFTIGLELSLARLRVMRARVLALGALQVAATSAVVAGAALAFGLDAPAAVVVGGGLALSSTAIVLQVLSERGTLGTRPGRAAFAVLLTQDLAVVPLLALLPLLGDERGGVAAALGLAAAKGAAALAVIVAAGRFVLRPMLAAVAATRSSELFTAVTLLLVLGVGWITEAAGVSMALGAFLAGILIAETEYRHQVEGTIEPFRGIFLALFFMIVGMGVDLGAIAERPLAVAALALGLLAAKAAVVGALALCLGQPRGAAVQLALALAQGGEFAFVLFGLAAGFGILDAATVAPLVAAVAITMALTPPLIALGEALARRLAAPPPGGGAELEDETADRRGHVVIAGFGRVGQTLARMLSACEIPHVALDLDLARVAEGRRRGQPVFYGDASVAEVLRASGLDRARAAVITLDHPGAAERAVHAVKAACPDVPIYVRARDDRHREALSSGGATVVVLEIVEASLQLGAAVLRGVGQPDDRVDSVVGGFRDNSYERLSGLLEGPDEEARPPAAAPGARRPAGGSGAQAGAGPGAAPRVTPSPPRA
jgi:CPA2 family monovalent cation:H+ antiporter-2